MSNDDADDGDAETEDGETKKRLLRDRGEEARIRSSSTVSETVGERTVGTGSRHQAVSSEQWAADSGHLGR